MTHNSIKKHRQISEVIASARSLASTGDNPEYDRALVELTANLIGLTQEYSDCPEAVETQILGRAVRNEDDYIYGIHYADDNTYRTCGTRARAVERMSAAHGDRLVRRSRKVEVPMGSWEFVR